MSVDWRNDLEAWLAPFLAALRHKTRARMCPAYVPGLIGPGNRKSIQPMAARDSEASYDQLPHFVSSGVWDAAPLEAVLLAEADRLVGGGDQHIGDAPVLELVHDPHPEFGAFGLLDPDAQDVFGPVGQYAEYDIHRLATFRRYKDRNRVKRMFGFLKYQRRIATRYDKTARSFASFLNIAAARVWLKSYANRIWGKA